MKRFLLGIFGGIVGFILAAVVFAQYSDYRAVVQSGAWIVQAGPAQRAVEANASRIGSLAGAGTGVAKPPFDGQGPEEFEVLSDGAIVMRGGAKGQVVVLVPSQGPDGIQWRCIGGSRAHVRCKPNPMGSEEASAGAPSKPAGQAASDLAACRILDSAIGPLRLESTLEQARKATPEAKFARTSDGEGVALVDVTVAGESLAVAYVGEEDAERPVDMSRRIEHIETFNAACATAEGIHPGSTVDDAVAAYGPVRIVRRSEIESREYIEFERQPPGLLFRLDYAGEFAEGQSETTRHAPGAKILSIAVSRP